MTPPSLTAVGGFATENGSWGVFGGHRGVWKEDRIRYLGGLGYADLQLTFYGTRPQTTGISRDIELRTVPFVQDLAARIPGSDFFAGLRYVFVSSDIELKPGRDIPGVTDREWTGDSKIGGLIPYLEYDSRDNFFTPGRGIHAKASLGFFDEIFGGDYDYREAARQGRRVLAGAAERRRGTPCRRPVRRRRRPVLRPPLRPAAGYPGDAVSGYRRADARNGGAVDGHAALGPCRVRGDREGGGRIRRPSGCGDRVERRRAGSAISPPGSSACRWGSTSRGGRSSGPSTSSSETPGTDTDAMTRSRKIFPLPARRSRDSGGPPRGAGLPRPAARQHEGVP